MDDLGIVGLVLLPLGLGLLGFVEPCSIGASLLFLKYVEGREAAVQAMQAAVFALTRAAFLGLLGAAAALAGGLFLAFQRTGWLVLGSLYLLLGLAYLMGRADRLMRPLGPRLAGLPAARGAAALAVLFGLNVPACAAPLLGVVLGAAAVGGAAEVAQGFAALALFGLALSLPLVLVVLWPPARRLLARASALSARAPTWIGLLLVALGLWSVVAALAAPPNG